MPETAEAASLTLKVTEAQPQDAGKGLARVDPADLSRLSAAVGSVVQITGKKTTVAKLMPAFREARGKQLVQIDGIIRSNAGAAIGEKVALSVVEAQPAQRITLASEGPQALRQPRAAGERAADLRSAHPAHGQRRRGGSSRARPAAHQPV